MRSANSIDIVPSRTLLETLDAGCTATWQAIQPDLVDRAMLPQAAALNGVNMNLARAVGPALGGAIVAIAGPGQVGQLDQFVVLAEPQEHRAEDPADRAYTVVIVK